MLETEIETFTASLPELLKTHAGKVVLIHGNALAGVYDDDATATAEGARLFGRGLFLVRPVVAASAMTSNRVTSERIRTMAREAAAQDDAGETEPFPV